MPTKSKKTISKTLMMWVALRKKDFEYEPPPTQLAENFITESGEDLLMESTEVLTT